MAMFRCGGGKNIKLIAYNISGNQTIDITSISNYKNLSDSNFVIELVEIPYARGGWFSMNTTSGQIQSNNGVQLTNTFSKSYDNDTGNLSISAKITAEMEHHGGGFVSGSTTSTAYCDIKYNVYAIY